MKSGSLVLRPSAMKATVTPEPSIPRELAVWALGVVALAWMTESAWGSSNGGWPLAGQVPAGGVRVGPVVFEVDGASRGLDSLMIWSGTTSATAGSAFSRASSPADTVADTA